MASVLVLARASYGCGKQHEHASHAPAAEEEEAAPVVEPTVPEVAAVSDSELAETATDSTGMIRCDGWTDWPGMCPAWSSEVESNRQSSDRRQDIQVQPSTPRPRRRSRALVLGWRRQVGFPNRLFGHLRVLPAAETSRPIAPVASGRMPSQQVVHDLLQFTLVVKRSFMTCLLTSRLQKAIYDLLGSQFRHNR